MAIDYTESIRKLKARLSLRFLGSVASLSIVTSGLGFSPAQASTAVILPATANGTDNSDLHVYACPGELHIWAPEPLTSDANPYSRYQNAQIGEFRWELFESNVGVRSWSSGGDGISQEVYRFGSSRQPDQELTFTLEGSIPSGRPSGVTYTPRSFTFTTTVVDPSFARGAGTQWDPYIVTSQEDLSKMRCHENKYFQLDRNITLSGKWHAIGSAAKEWRGQFDGANFSISGLNTGHPSSRNVGLFGLLRFSAIRNLTLNAPIAEGTSNVGTLFGSGSNGVSVTNVKILNASVSGNRAIGLMAGYKVNGGLVTRVEATGTVRGLTQAHPRVETNNIFDPLFNLESITARGAQNIGGFIGFDDGESNNWVNVKVDVDIVVGPEFNYEAKRIANNRPDSNMNAGPRRIGGFLGDNDFRNTYKYLDLTSRIRIEDFGEIREVGGFGGYNEDALSNSRIDTKIYIVSLGVAGNQNPSVTYVGGAMGYANDPTVSFSEVDSTILIERANGLNNSLGVTNQSQLLDVSQIGGMGGEYDDNTTDFYNRVKTDIDIINANTVEYVGGFVGSFDDVDSMGALDNFVSGSIDITALSSVSNVGGFTNLDNSGFISGTRNIAAMSINIQSPSQTHVNPFVGFVARLNDQVTFHAYWDSTLNNAANANNYPAIGVSTAQLQNQSFLAGIGFDFDNIWQISSGYPELRQGVYRGQYSGSQPQAPSTPSVTVVTSGSSSFGPAGGLLQLEGDGLRGLGQVKLGNQSLFVQTLSDTTAAVLIPAGLSAGSYDLDVTGLHGTLRMQAAVTITAPSADIEPGYWTQLQPDGTVKMYAKNIIGEGKVQFYQNGQEIAWVNATDALDPKLSSANGFYYLVRTRELVAGKNAFEIYLDGNRIWRAAYTNR